MDCYSATCCYYKHDFAAIRIKMDYPYKNHEVRDLAWACFEPPLMHSRYLADDDFEVNNCGLELTAARKNWLLTLDRNPDHLREHIAKTRSHRLGIYFEGLWHYFLQQDEDIDLVAHNLPIRMNGKTLGEFDCLYYCHRRQRHFHLELAVKYFLSNRSVTSGNTQSQWHEWWGPECQDRLDLKIRHLVDRQIRLGDLPPAREEISRLGINDLHREIEIKGYLFQSLNDPLSMPPGYNQTRPACNWVHLTKLENLTSVLRDACFRVLPKLEWLSPSQLTEEEPVLSGPDLTASLRDHFSRDTRPQLVTALNQGGSELSRFFVVGDGWPDGDGTRH